MIQQGGCHRALRPLSTIKSSHDQGIACMNSNSHTECANMTHTANCMLHLRILYFSVPNATHFLRNAATPVILRISSGSERYPNPVSSTDMKKCTCGTSGIFRSHHSRRKRARSPFETLFPRLTYWCEYLAACLPPISYTQPLRDPNTARSIDSHEFIAIPVGGDPIPVDILPLQPQSLGTDACQVTYTLAARKVDATVTLRPNSQQTCGERARV
jgi:hypothetical protein